MITASPSVPSDQLLQIQTELQRLPQAPIITPGKKRLTSQDLIQSILSNPATTNPSISRSTIYREMLNNPNSSFYQNPNPGSIKNVYINFIFQLYDKYFFNARITQLVQTTKSQLSFLANPKLNKTAGMCNLRNNCQYQIQIGWETIVNGLSQANLNATVGGLPCQDRLTCMQLTFEHELVHLIILMSRIRETSHGPNFQNLLRMYFQHNVSTHDLFGKNILGKDDFQIGQKVQFTTTSGEFVTGWIAKLNPKTAGIVIADAFGNPDPKKTGKASYSLLTVIPGDIRDVKIPRKSSQISGKKGDLGGVIPMDLKDNFQIGERVSYELKGLTMSGTITKLNLKTAGVTLPTDDYYRVLYHKLTKII